MNESLLIIIIPAVCAGALILLSHVPLGMEVLKRGIIFIDIAIAQIAGFGIILAGYLGFAPHGIELQLTALASALSGAALLSLIEKKSGQYQEAIIGIAFIMAATGSIVLLSKNPQGGEHLQNLLAGQILWIEWPQLIFPATIGLLVFSIWYCKPAILSGSLFYYIFAVAITMSVQVIGVYLVFASLIIPAISVLKLPQPKAVYVAMVIGLLGYVAGLMVSSIFDLPSGAVIVWMLVLIALSGTLFFKKLNVPRY